MPWIKLTIIRNFLREFWYLFHHFCYLIFHFCEFLNFIVNSLKDNRVDFTLHVPLNDVIHHYKAHQIYFENLNNLPSGENSHFTITLKGVAHWPFDLHRWKSRTDTKINDLKTNLFRINKNRKFCYPVPFSSI